MGTSLSGLTPATTFDGLLKVGDNDPLTADLKAISTGDGVDTILELSTTALQIGGATGMYWDNTNGRLGIGTNAPQTTLEINGAIRSSGTNTQIIEFSRATIGQFRAVFGSVGFRVGNSGGMFVGSADGAPAANTRLHIKGIGESSGTTSLLVQNSAGTDMLKVTDDKKLRFVGQFDLLYNSSFGIVKNTQSLTLKDYAINNEIFTAGAFKSVLYSDAASGGFVGINNETPTAQLHIKGTAPVEDPPGTFSNPTVLLVENNAGTDLLKVTHDGVLKILNTLNIYSDGINDLKRIGTGTGLGIGTNKFYPAASTQVHIKGLGNDATTTALLVQNSDGDGVIRVRDDKTIWLGNTEIVGLSYYNNVIPGFNGGLNVRYNNGARFGVGNTASTMVMTATAKVGIGEDDPTARLHVKGEAPVESPPGSGTFTNPTALLVENSAGADLLKIDDGGVTTITSSTQSVPLYVSATGSGTGGIEIRSTSLRRFRILATSTITTLEATNTGGITTNSSLNVGGSAAADASAVLQADSTTKGFLPPRMTETERLAINMVGDPAVSTPAEGLMVYQTAPTVGLYIYSESAWKQVQLIG